MDDAARHAELAERVRIFHTKVPGDLRDFSKIDIRDGVIYYKLYQQDGSFQQMTCADTYDNRMNVSWMQIHDRDQSAPTA